MQQPAQIQNTPITIYVSNAFGILLNISHLVVGKLNRSTNFMQLSPVMLTLTRLNAILLIVLI